MRKLELMDTKIAAKGGAKKGCCGGKTLQQKRDALQEKLKEINSQLLEEHAEFSAPKMNCGANYLVLLRSFRAAAVATSIRCHGVQGIHKVERAPVPHDLNYKSLEASAQMATFTKKHIFQILFVLLVIFYLIPIVAVGMVLTAENLSFLTPVFDALGEQGTAAFVATCSTHATLSSSTPTMPRAVAVAGPPTRAGLSSCSTRRSWFCSSFRASTARPSPRRSVCCR